MHIMWLMCVKLFKGQAPPLYLMLSVGVKIIAEKEYVIAIAGRDFDVSLSNDDSVTNLYPGVVELIETWLQTIDKAACQEPMPEDLMFCVYGK